jgi:Chitobiase/beta-hexosaminidase C-terminal domain
MTLKAQNRTVPDTEVGSIFQSPDGVFPYSDYGAFVGSPSASLAPQGIIGVYGQAFQLASGTLYGQPLATLYSELKTYQTAQVAAGNAPIFVTATYQGVSRPVYYGPSLALNSAGVPTAPSANWQQAVNVSDPRFVNLWITEYAQKLLTGSSWLELDEGIFEYAVYGVLNDDGVYVPGVTWDEPFPQNDTEFLEGIGSFYTQVAEYNKSSAAPVYTMTNLGTISQPALYSTVFANAPAVIYENLYIWYTNPSSTIRNAFFDQSFQLFPWMAAQNKIGILRAILPSGSSNLLTAFAEYSLLKGMNFFFAPGNTSGDSTDPSLWSAYSAALGKPISAMTYGSASSLGAGYRLYQRNYEGGTVYLNWTGSTQTIALSSSTAHYNIYGEKVTSITIADGVGTYVSFETNNLPMPHISPVYNHAVDGDVTVTITSSVAGATIRYTIDGAAVGDSSPVYTGPFTLSGNATVQARAFLEGSMPSYASVISYTIE